MSYYHRSLIAVVAAIAFASSAPAHASGPASLRDVVLESGWWQIFWLPPNPCSLYRCHTR